MEEKATTQIRTVLLVDDNDDARILTKWFLDNFGYAVDSVQNAEEALTRFDPKIHQLVLTDNSMSGMSGAELAQEVKQRSPSTPTVMYSGNPPLDSAYIDVVITKPAHLLDVKEAIDKLISAQKFTE